MHYFASTQPTINWILSHKNILRELSEKLGEVSQIQGLESSVLVAGSLRIAAERRSSLLVLWNVEYVGNSGAEKWGVIRLQPTFGLLDSAFRDVVLERELNVINFRHQGLRINDAWAYRGYQNAIITCMSGRGEDARHSSIAYFDGNVVVSNSRRPVVLCVGPWSGSNADPEIDNKPLVEFLESEIPRLGQVVASA